MKIDQSINGTLNKKINGEEIGMHYKVNNNWIDEEEIETENIDERIEGIIHRKINEVINLMREREELYEVRLLIELQDETDKIEMLKNQLVRIVIYETNKEEKDHFRISDLNNVIEWIEEEQEKYKL